MNRFGLEPQLKNMKIKLAKQTIRKRNKKIENKMKLKRKENKN